MGNYLERQDLLGNQDDEVGARELGLKNNLKLAEVNTLIDYYKRKDPNNVGLLPEQFKEAAGEFIASGLTIDPNLIFNIFNTGDGSVPDRVTLREFVLGYAILCRGSADGRLKYLFAIYGNVEGDGYLTRDQLISSLKLMQRIVTEVTDHEARLDEEENEKQIITVADELISAASESHDEGISYDDFIERVKEAEVVTPWLEDLSAVAGDHLKYIERRELDAVELYMERQGILTTDSQNAPLTLLSDTDWSKDEALALGRTDASSASERNTRIPLPKRYKLVRRDMKSGQGGKEKNDKVARSPGYEESGYNESNAAKPFVINHDQIKFGKILGRGACATVYECEWLHVPVAVKVFNDGQGEAAGIEKLGTSDEEVRKNIVGDYVEEFWLLLQIRHPNCLLYMGICFEPVVCIVTELFSGGSVSNFLHGGNPRKFLPSQAIEMLCGVARGMYYLHASSPPILHRDLKASNILINRTVTHCVICDFGLSSQFVSEASGLHSNGETPDGALGGVGTPYTMAPEVMQRKPYTPAADVYSFGIVLYEMYTGRFPFPKMKPIQLMFHVTEGGRPKFYDDDKVPPSLVELITKCWAQDPSKRPSFEEILEVLTSSQLTEEISEREDTTAVAEVVSAYAGDDEDDANFQDTALSKRLLEAIYRGQQDKAARLIDQGAKVNYSDYDKRTALHVAAAEGHTKCIRLLLSAGARLTHDRWGNSPIADASNYANRTGDSEPARILRALEGRSEGSTQVGDSERAVDSSQIELLRQSTAMKASADGDIVTLKRLLDSGLEVDCADYDRRTPLTVASSEGRRDIVELLIRQGADVSHRDRWASTAYHEAERGGYHDIIRLLRQAADPGMMRSPPKSYKLGSSFP